MQGRLCEKVDGKIQAFPWRDWETEFPAAAAIGVHLMEWTLDQERLYENPLMNGEGQVRIRSLCQRHDVAIPSLTGDCFMQAPFWKVDGAASVALQGDFIAICRACASVGVLMIVVPLVDNGRLESTEQETSLVEYLLGHESLFASLGLQIIFESDYVPQELKRFISLLPEDRFGINYDIGNSAALGFDPAEEFAAYGERIVNVHVKDRMLGGTTVPLTSGSADFGTVFAELGRLGYSGNFILQTARAANDDHADVLGRYRDMTLQWMKQNGLAVG